MSKVNLRAQNLIEIIKQLIIQNDEVLNYQNIEWTGKSISEILNIRYFDYKRRIDGKKEELLKEALKSKTEPVSLQSLDDSYCLVSIDSNARTFNQNIDFQAFSATLMFWAQTSKIQLLEYLINKIAISLVGERYQIPNISRSMMMLMSPLKVTEVLTSSEIGESFIATVALNFNLTENLSVASDYSLKMKMTVPGQDTQQEFNVPFNTLKIAYTAVPKSLSQPNLQLSGIRNTVSSIVISFTIYQYINDLGKCLDNLVVNHLSGDNNAYANNNLIPIVLTTPNGLTQNYTLVCAAADCTVSMTEPNIISVTLQPYAFSEV